jgi:phage shock protein E
MLLKMKKGMLAGCIGLLLTCSAFARDVVIDVRTAQEFQSGHIEGALNLPHDTIAQDIARAKVNKDDHVILYCRSGRRSGLALNTLKGLGFSNSENFGGFEEAQRRLRKP